jgi:hypothetical protein
VATARFTIYIAPSHGRPGRPLMPDDVIADDARFGWRMLAANNREVARSSGTYRDVMSCVEALRSLRGNVSSGLAVAARTGRSDWSWRLRIHGVDEATSSRTYQRRLQCEAACTLFIDLVPCAELVDLRASAHFIPARRRRVVDPVVNPQYGTQRG